VTRSGGGHALGGTGAIPTAGTVTLTDSLTYTSLADVRVQGQLSIRAGDLQRPIIRLAPTAGGWTRWTITGAAGTTRNCLVLDGLFLSGADIVLTGQFDCVTLTCCTLDPGSAAPIPPAHGSSPPWSVFALAADGRELVPCRLWIEGTIGSLTVSRCLTGPIRTRGNGQVGTLTITESILQAIPSAAAGPIAVRDVKDPVGLEEQLKDPGDPVAAYLRGLSPALGLLVGGPASVPYSQPLFQSLLNDLNALAAGRSLYDPTVFQNVVLSAATRQLLLSPPGGYSAPAPLLNRHLLEDAFPRALADAALALNDGDVILSRCTVLGRVAVHRLQASECILQDLAQVDDAQHGCVRFSAWSDGSLLPRQFQSVRIAPGAALFTSTAFGQPGYGQLLPTVDAAILPAPATVAAAPPTIAAGAEDGSEMGAFAREKYPIKERGLLIKLQEYMPAGLVPVLIYVT
jgi:hypothetical protein